MFRVRVVPRGRLAKDSRVGRQGTEIELPEGARVRELLAEVGLFDEEVRRVVVNGRRGRLDQRLRRNDVVEVHG
jgi:sulfur carrier protein ThiS